MDQGDYFTQQLDGDMLWDNISLGGYFKNLIKSSKYSVLIRKYSVLIREYPVIN
jgi:hypothetical protein